MLERRLAALFSAVIVIAVVAFLYFTVWVVAPMTRPTSYFEKITENVSERTVGTEGLDQLSVDLAVMLEYASASIRTTQVQIALALVGGMLFGAIGVILLVMNVSGALRIQLEATGGKMYLETVAPGIASLCFGAVLIGLGVLRDVSRPFAGEVFRPFHGGVTATTQSLGPPSTSDPTPALERQENAAAEQENPGSPALP